jgi:hypothetical protein
MTPTFTRDDGRFFEQNRFIGNLAFAFSQTLLPPYEQHGMTPDEITIDPALTITGVEYHSAGWLRVWGRVDDTEVCSLVYRLSPTDRWRVRDYARALAAMRGVNVVVKSK